MQVGAEYFIGGEPYNDTSKISKKTSLGNRLQKLADLIIDPLGCFLAQPMPGLEHSSDSQV